MTEQNGRIVLRLDRMMVERHVSRQDLAAQVGLTPANLSPLTNTRVSALRRSTLAAICEARDCQPGDLLEYIDE